jgi:excisionase family DNA binding protein
MIRNRRPDWRRIKGKLSYTIDEVARALGTHRNTVRHWIRKAGLPAMTDARPHLILGSDLVAFLRTRRASRKRRCGVG